MSLVIFSLDGLSSKIWIAYFLMESSKECSNEDSKIRHRAYEQSAELLRDKPAPFPEHWK